MKMNELDYGREIEGSYLFDGEYYCIQDEKVFVMTDEGPVFTDKIKADQIRFHGEILIDRPELFELLIKEIKEIGNDEALIHADDGSGFDFWFVEDNYSKHKEDYKSGQKGNYRIFADILSSELPENFRDGVLLEGEAARKWFDWVGDDVEDGATAIVPLNEIADYKETVDFEKTGIYEFNATVNNPGFSENPGEEEGGDLFEIAIMNQFNKKEPRFITAEFQNPPYTFPAFEPDEDDEDELFCSGWALKGTMRFTVGRASEKILSEEGIYKYSSNEFTFAEDKGFQSFDDEDYIEDSDGGRILDPSKIFKYFDEE